MIKPALACDDFLIFSKVKLLTKKFLIKPMEKIVVYDLNQCLYRKSSKDEFFKFICYKKGYKLIHLAQIGWLKLIGKTPLIDKTSFKENFYNYLNHLSPEQVQKYARQFWDIEYPEYFRSEMVEDIKRFAAEGVKVYIITGGLEIYTKYLEELLPLEVMGTQTKYENEEYKVIGEACNGEEKVRRLKEATPGNYILLVAYSDDDEEILYEAEKGYLLKDGKLELVEKKEK